MVYCPNSRSSDEQQSSYSGTCPLLQTILIVDDSASQLATLSMLLMKYGYKVRMAKDGHEALDLYKHNPTAIVISNWMMPGLTGPELCREIRTIKKRCYTYFILLTSKSEKADVANGLNSGADDFLSKPVNKYELLARLTAGKRILQLQYGVEYVASHDKLTDLPNRYFFHDRLTSALDSANKTGRRTGLILIDVDNFKTVNDTYGHASGDALLVNFAKRLRSCARKHDTVARLGGDEFAIISPGVDNAETVIRIAERVQDSLQNGISQGGDTTMISASIGIAVYPDDGRSIKCLLKNADTALYAAKARGRACTAIFDQRLAELASARQHALTSIKAAIDSDESEIVPYFQPIVDASSHEIVGFEALARRVHRDGTVCFPSSFSAALEDGILSRGIGNAVIARTLGAIEDWIEKNLSFGRVSINVSSSQLMENNFSAQLIDKLESRKIKPGLITIEITESVSLTNDTNSKIRDSLSYLSAKGIGIDLDDFGTGFASLSHLSKFHVDRIKIDKSFVERLPRDNHSLGVIKAITTLARQLNKEVVAEGVETFEQAKLLRDIGCDYLQGFLFSKAVKATEAETMMGRPRWRELNCKKAICA